MKLKVYKTDGKATKRSVTLDTAVFGIEPNDQAIWLDVRSIQAAGRQGTHKSKERGEVRGWRSKAMAPERNGSRPCRNHAFAAVDRRGACLWSETAQIQCWRQSEDKAPRTPIGSDLQGAS